ncbi:hypothetical protein F1D05_09740 [Kribbella qitaiheensis]|uniref:DUF2493 domain-containing protein n=1 Tax=Kribbella qitaiheensis TaxID=1544730 RepID=A0A7G6WVV3_9ACTN|nr:hypothetical protein [Kribbella qitaiheensis]QNE18118.1 hypothetical protein F1D05_09740 [Kribbella qitaiheensis]
MPNVIARRADEEGPVKAASRLRPSHVLLVTGARSWNNEAYMRASFRDTWQAWGPSNVTHPLLLSGHCPADRLGRGADAMAEKLWELAGFEVFPVPADWKAHGRRAGFVRNQQMVDVVVSLRARGSVVRCLAYLDLCRKPACFQRANEQLMPQLAGHFSHGTVDCRAAAVRAGLETLDVVSPSLVPV